VLPIDHHARFSIIVEGVRELSKIAKRTCLSGVLFFLACSAISKDPSNNSKDKVGAGDAVSQGSGMRAEDAASASSVLDASVSGPLDYASCTSISADTSRSLGDALDGVPQCAVDSDCAVLDVDVCIFRCAPVVGSAEFEDSLRAAMAGRLSSACDEFYEGDCLRFPVSCPPIPPPTSYVCSDGLCKGNGE